MSEITPLPDLKNPKEGDLRFVYIPQAPMHPLVIPVRSIEEGAVVLNAVVSLSIFEYKNNIKPDYTDYAGIERYEENPYDGYDWYSLNGKDDGVNEIFDALGLEGVYL